MSSYSIEVTNGERFEFGNNWSDFLKHLDNERIQVASEYLNEYLETKDLKGLSFLDVGCGSGLFSLAARKLGAKVYSFDFDPSSVACSMKLKNMFLQNDSDWIIKEGSVLDLNYLDSLGKFNIVYSWGVLHHTGNMWQAIENLLHLVEARGVFFIAIYNKQGWKSKFWWYIKYLYNKLPSFLHKIFALSIGLLFQAINIIKYTILLKPFVAIRPLLNYKKNRGMNFKNDIIDWIGGFPYEYATIDELNEFFIKNNFTIQKEFRTNSLGCNQVIYRRN